MSTLLYVGTLGHGYVLDDAIVISENVLTQQGLAGIPDIFSHDSFYGFFQQEGKDKLVAGGRYRPLSLAMFALEYELFGLTPFWGHLFNIFYYGLCICSLFYFLLFLLQTGPKVSGVVTIAFVATLIYAAHPIHTEVVANIKGRDEIMAFLLSIWSMYAAIRFAESQRWSYAGYAMLAFVAALLSKEIAVSFLAVLPVLLLLLRQYTWSNMLRAWAPLVVGFAAYLMVRIAVIGLDVGGAPTLELMNNPFVKVEQGQYLPMEASEKYPMILHGLGKYLQLSIWPHPLTHDYYPRQIPILSWTNSRVVLSLAAVVLLLWLGWYLRRRLPWLAFAIFFFFATLFLTSNLVFPIGTNLSERFLFIPSLSVCLALAWGLSRLATRYRPATAMAVGGVILLAFATLTLMRNPAWESNYRLFTTDVRTSPNSAKIRNAVGGETIARAIQLSDTAAMRKSLIEARSHLARAVEIHPNYKNAHLLSGNASFYLREYEAAIRHYDRALSLDPAYAEALTNRAFAYRDWGRLQGERMGNLDVAIQYLEKSVAHLTEDHETNRLLGVAYGNKGDSVKAIKYFSKAIEIDPTDSWSHFNLGHAYLSVGDTLNANRYISKAKTLNPQIGK